jgi:hypothetical protein
MSLQALRTHWFRARRSAIFFGIFATAVRVGANLLLLPILLTKLPTNDLALWWVFVSLGGFVNLADFGFGATIARVYSYLWAGAEDFEAEGLSAPAVNRPPNLTRIRELNATVRYFYWTISIATTFVIAAIGTFVLLKPVSGCTNAHSAWLAWVFQVFLIGFGLGTSRWTLACQGLGRTKELQIAYLWSGIANLSLATVLLLCNWWLFALLTANLVRLMILRWYCRAVYYGSVPKIQGLRLKPNWEMLKRLWPNASKLGVLAIGAYLLSNGNILICSQNLNPELTPGVTASFGLMATLGGFMTNFSALWLAVKWPQINMLRMQGRLEEMSTLFARRLALVIITFVASATLVVLIGNYLLALKGTHTRLLPVPYLIFYFSYLAYQLFYVQFGTLAYSENVVPFFKVSIFTGIGMFILSYFMTRSFGLWGMLIAPLIAESACNSWYTVRRGFRGQPLTAKQLVRAGLTAPI